MYVLKWVSPPPDTICRYVAGISTEGSKGPPTYSYVHRLDDARLFTSVREALGFIERNASNNRWHHGSLALIRVKQTDLVEDGEVS